MGTTRVFPRLRRLTSGSEPLSWTKIIINVFISGPSASCDGVITQFSHYDSWLQSRTLFKGDLTPSWLPQQPLLEMSGHKNLIRSLPNKVPTSWSKKQVLKRVLKFPDSLHMKSCWPTNRCLSRLTRRWSTLFWMSNDSFNSHGHWELCSYHLVHNQLHKTTVIRNRTRQHAARCTQPAFPKKVTGVFWGDLEWSLPQLFNRRAQKHTSKYTSANVNDGYLVNRWAQYLRLRTSSATWRLSDSTVRNKRGDKHLAFSLSGVIPSSQVRRCRYVRF